MAPVWVPSGSALCWQYNWPLKFVFNSLTVTDFIGIHPLEVTKAFRLGIGLSHEGKVNRLLCYVSTVDLARLGFRVRGVTCCLQKDTGKLKLKELEQVSDNGTDLLFSWDKASVTTCHDLQPCLTFQLHLTGTVDQYITERFDTQLELQLYRAITNKTMTDVQLKVGRDAFPFHVHKFVLAARSPVFRAMFEADMVEARTGIVEIPDVDPEIFRQFLHFVYTGKLVKPTSKELGIVAEKYQVETLISLCREADVIEETVEAGLLGFAESMTTSYNYKKKFTVPSQGAQVGIQGILSVESYLVQNVAQQVNTGSQSILEDVLFYKLDSTPSDPSANHQVTFYCNRKEGLAWKIASVQLLMSEGQNESSRIAMASKIPIEATDKQPLQVFTASVKAAHCNANGTFRFIVHRATNVGIFQYQLRDSLFAKQLWSSAMNKELTDMEFQVGDRTLPAHAAILRVRSAMEIQGQPSPSDPLIHHVTTMDADVWEELLHFLYTGLIRKSPLDESLCMAAETYRIGTLELVARKKVIGLDQDQLSEAILSLI